MNDTESFIKEHILTICNIHIYVMHEIQFEQTENFTFKYIK